MRQVRHDEENYLLDVILVAGAGDAEANIVWCDVVIPRNVDPNEVAVPGTSSESFPPPEGC